MLILPSYTLWKREIVRFYRQRSRVIGALVPPVLFWFLIGSGFGSSFSYQSDSSVNYLQYFFPGTVIMVVLFTAIFSTISIIEDRREGFLQSVLVAPVTRSSIALGKILGGATLAFLQGFLFLAFAPLLGIHFSFLSALYIATILFLVSFGLTGLGFAIAWQMDTTQGFHAIMNLFLMPMWFLSGSLFPLEGAPVWLKFAMLINPLTYGVTALRHGLFHASTAAAFSPGFCLLITLLFCVVMFIISVILVRRPLHK